MSDVEKAIEILKYYKPKKDELIHERDATYKDRDYFDLAISTLEKQSDKNWIPISEQPEKSGWYLCTLDGEICGNDKPFVGMSLFDRRKGKWDEEDAILAWQPLPEPWKESVAE